MKRYYTCEFKSDIILKASTNTEGDSPNLDFIPGNAFLGMVARNYDKFKDPFYVFHSGEVKFGDGDILIESLVDGKITLKPGYKIPLCFCNLKVGEGYYNRLFLSDKDEQDFIDSQKQLKQLRDGYINEDYFSHSFNYNYSQKSAHDEKNRRSKDGYMFGYTSFDKGLKFLFSIECSDDETLDQIEKFLLGEQLLGKSKTAQYGRVLIEKSNLNDEIDSFKPNGNLTYIYAKSRIALFDEFGNPTLLRNASDLGLKSGQIDFRNSHIKVGNYIPYNAKKISCEMMRYFIKKGSVITIRNLDKDEKIPKYIGSFQNEGFGAILVNPKFLNVDSSNENFDIAKNNEKLVKFKKAQIKNTKEPQTNLIKFLSKKEREDTQFLELVDKVEAFKNKVKTPTNSQWSAINNFAISSKNDDEMIKNIEKFISSGVSKKDWDGCRKDFIEKIKSISNKKMFVRLLSARCRKDSKWVKKASYQI